MCDPGDGQKQEHQSSANMPANKTEHASQQRAHNHQDSDAPVAANFDCCCCCCCCLATAVFADWMLGALRWRSMAALCVHAVSRQPQNHNQTIQGEAALRRQCNFRLTLQMCGGGSISGPLPFLKPLLATQEHIQASCFLCCGSGAGPKVWAPPLCSLFSHGAWILNC